MTLVSLPSPMLFPGITNGIAGSPTLATAQTLDASGEYQAYIFIAREDMTIGYVSFRAGTVAGSPTADVRIETVDTSTGMPSGTLWATNTNATTATISSNTTVGTALTASATITKGQAFCVKIVYASGTSIIIQQVGSLTSPSAASLPCVVTNVTGSAVKTNMGSLPCLALGSNSTTFYQVPGIFQLTAISAGSFNNTNSAKRGLKFTPPMKCRAIGIRWFNANAAGDFNIVLFDNGGTPAELGSSSTAFDGDTASTVQTCLHAYFDNPVGLTAGATYRVVNEPSSATNCNVSTITLPSADYFGASPAGGTAVYTSFATATWTDSTTQLPLMDVILDQLDDGASVGGGGGQRVISG